MPLLIFFLIIIFLFIILYPFFLWITTIREGVKNKNSSQDASGNSSSSSDLEQTVSDLSANVATLQTQVNGIVQAQQQYTTQMAPSEPNVTGADDPLGNS
jgi:hypothetical protein